MISDAIKKMQAMARKAQEETYDGKCTVTEFQPIKDSRTKITSEKEVVVLEDEPCRLSYSNVSAVDQTESATKVAQVTKLFCPLIQRLSLEARSQSRRQASHVHMNAVVYLRFIRRIRRLCLHCQRGMHDGRNGKF